MGYPNWFPLKKGATLIAAYDGSTPSVTDMEFLPDDKQYAPAAIWRDCKRFQSALKAAQDMSGSLDSAIAKEIAAIDSPPGYALFRLSTQYGAAVADGPEFCRATAAYLANRRIPIALRAAVPPELRSHGKRFADSQQLLLAAQFKLLEEAKSSPRGGPYPTELTNQLYSLYLQEPLARDEPLPEIDTQQKAVLRSLLLDGALTSSTNFNLKEVVNQWFKL